MPNKLSEIKNRLSTAKNSGFKLDPKKALTVIGVVVAVAVLFLVGWSLMKSGPDRAREKQIVQKLDNLNNKEEVTCQEVLNEVGDASADNLSNEDKKIDLLNRQMSCFSDKGNFDAAISAAQELKAIYDSKGDKEQSALVDQYIKDMQAGKQQLERDNGQ